MDKIVDTFDSTIFKNKESGAFDPVHVINKRREQREIMIYGTQFQTLEKILQGKKTAQVKSKLIRDAMKSRLIRSMLSCFAQSETHIMDIHKLVRSLFTMYSENELTNEDRQCWLNANFAMFYKCKEGSNQIFPFDSARENSYMVA